MSWTKTGWQTIDGKTDAALAAVFFTPPFSAELLFLFAKGTDDTLWVRTTADGQNWANWEPLDGATDVAPTATTFQNKIYLFRKGIDPNAIYVRNTDDGKNWTPWAKLDGTTDVALAAASFKNELYLFGKGIDNKAHYVRHSSDGVKWSAWKKLDGTTDVAQAATAYKDELYLFAKGVSPSTSIYFRSTKDGVNWGKWNRIEGAPTDAPVAVSWRAGRPYLHICRKNVVGDKVLSSTTGTVPPAFTGWADMGRITSSAPAIAQTFHDQRDVRVVFIPGEAGDIQVHVSTNL